MSQTFLRALRLFSDGPFAGAALISRPGYRRGMLTAAQDSVDPARHHQAGQPWRVIDSHSRQAEVLPLGSLHDLGRCPALRHFGLPIHLFFARLVGLPRWVVLGQRMDALYGPIGAGPLLGVFSNIRLAAH